MSKYYGVKKGNKVGIFSSWNECKTSVNGYPNAQFKSFKNYDDAYKFVFDKSDEVLDKDNDEYDIVAYIDASYDNAIKRYSYAGIIFDKGERNDFAYSSDDADMVKHRNVSGELMAAMEVIKYAEENDRKSVLICYDYAGIENWAIGAWKANTDLTRHYANYMKSAMKKFKIYFKKIKSHSGDKYNEEVDELAKKALGKYNGSTVDNSIDKDEVVNLPLEEDYLNKLNPKKKSLDLGFLIEEKLFTSDDIYIVFKEKWKSENRYLNEINEIKSYYDTNKGQFIFIVKTDKDVKIVTIEGEKLYD